MLSTETIQAAIAGYFAASRSTENKEEQMVSFFAEDTVSYDPVGGPALEGHAGLLQYFQAVASLFEQVGLTEEFVTIADKEAAVKWKGRGVGKNGCEVTFEGIDMFEFNDAGKIQSMRAYWNPAATIAELQS